MRAWWPLVLFLLIVPGCIEKAAVDDDRTCADCQDDGTGDGPVIDPPLGTDGFDAPRLVAGTAWTYAMSGPWAFHDKVTLVVTTTPDGYLFAGASRDDLTQHVLGEGVLLFGPRDAHLNPVYDGKLELMPFAFPLFDGKTWTHDGTDWSARAATLELLGAPRTVLTITGTNGDRTFTYGYAPDLGAITSLSMDIAGRGTLWTYTLTGVDRADTATWFEYVTFMASGTETSATPHTVPDTAETVLIESWGSAAAHAVVTSPSGETTRFQGKGHDEAEVVLLEAEAGEWLVATAVPPEETYTVWLLSVRWTDLGLGD